MAERKQRPGWASLLIGALLLISQILMYHIFKLVLINWRVSLFFFMFLGVALLLGIISLWEDWNERLPGIIGLVLVITAITHQIIIIVNPYFLK